MAAFIARRVYRDVRKLLDWKNILYGAVRALADRRDGKHAHDRTGLRLDFKLGLNACVLLLLLFDLLGFSKKFTILPYAVLLLLFFDLLGLLIDRLIVIRNCGIDLVDHHIAVVRSLLHEKVEGWLELPLDGKVIRSL